MQDLLHNLIFASARRTPNAPALTAKAETLDYATLAERVSTLASALTGHHLQRQDRIAVYLDKRIDTVVAIFGATAAGCVFVPLNPLLKPPQVAYILKDCNVRTLITSRDRLDGLSDVLADCPDLRLAVTVDGPVDEAIKDGPAVIAMDELLAGPMGDPHRVIDTDMAGILYTSGSTGNPKGVVLSHRNMVAGAKSVAEYLKNTAEDRILSVLPLSFDAGFSQLTTAFHVGAKVVLINYLLPRDVVRICEKEQITGLTCVPPLWFQLAQQDWPDGASKQLRYFANTGGHMPGPTLASLRAIFSNASPYLMYGLTEAFRSTYLDPGEVDTRPDSIGKAIPGAEILVVRPDGTPCQAGETGELVHRGALVALGYWNDPERTNERFRPVPGQAKEICTTELSVWSGDLVRRDEAGFLYFVGRNDEMIKTSGYRVSPTEVEDAIYATNMVDEAVALGISHAALGQAIVVIATPRDGKAFDGEALTQECRHQLPLYMVPAMVMERPSLPRSANGKIDRKALSAEVADTFKDIQP